MFESFDRDGCDLVTVYPPEMVRKPSVVLHRSMIGAELAEAGCYRVSAPPPAEPRGLTRPSLRSSLAVSDIVDNAHCEGRVDGERLLGVDANLTLAGNDRPVYLVVILPGLNLRDIRHFVRLVLNRQVLGPPDDRAGRDPWVNPHRDSQAAVDRKRVVVKLHHSGCGHLVFAATPVCRRVEAQQWSRRVRQNLGGK